MLTDEEIEIFMTSVVKFDDMSVDELKEWFMKMMKRAVENVEMTFEQRHEDMKLMEVVTQHKDINTVEWYTEAAKKLKDNK